MNWYSDTAMNVVPPRVNIGATKRPSQWERIKESVSNWRDEFEVAATDALKSYNVRKKKWSQHIYSIL